LRRKQWGRQLIALIDVGIAAPGPASGNTRPNLYSAPQPNVFPELNSGKKPTLASRSEARRLVFKIIDVRVTPKIDDRHGRDGRGAERGQPWLTLRQDPALALSNWVLAQAASRLSTPAMDPRACDGRTTVRPLWFLAPASRENRQPNVKASW
jgi:hypothetical protein